MAFVIRPAAPGDEEVILGLLRELAQYEKLTHIFQLTRELVARDILGPAKILHCDLAYSDGLPVGLATWYWTYTSFAAARGIYLEDLFVREIERGQGFGKALLAQLAKQARANGAVRVEWSVLTWNKPSIEFYESLGAKPVAGWFVYRLDGAALEKMAE